MLSLSVLCLLACGSRGRSDVLYPSNQTDGVNFSVPKADMNCRMQLFEAYHLGLSDWLEVIGPYDLPIVASKTSFG